MTERRIEDDAFNTGWNAAMESAVRDVKKLPAMAIAEDGITVLVPKAAVLNLLRGGDR